MDHALPCSVLSASHRSLLRWVRSGESVGARRRRVSARTCEGAGGGGLSAANSAQQGADHSPQPFDVDLA